jgi:hypothetical protein
VKYRISVRTTWTTSNYQSQFTAMQAQFTNDLLTWLGVAYTWIISPSYQDQYQTYSFTQVYYLYFDIVGPVNTSLTNRMCRTNLPPLLPPLLSSSFV